MPISHQTSCHDVDATPAWAALIDGHWSVRDLGALDGRRSYALLEIAPEDRHRHRLSAVEARVLRSYARGVAGKDVAYTLGLSQSTVSEVMRSAGVKLGTPNRLALIQLAAHLLGTQRAVAAHVLTRAERDVLQYLSQGHTNSEIAALRGSSIRTVANQVASVLRKLRLPSRTAAAVLSIFSLAVVHAVRHSAT